MPEEACVEANTLPRGVSGQGSLTLVSYEMNISMLFDMRKNEGEIRPGAQDNS